MTVTYDAILSICFYSVGLGAVDNQIILPNTRPTDAAALIPP